jgi:hypothetical protein
MRNSCLAAGTGVDRTTRVETCRYINAILEHFYTSWTWIFESTIESASRSGVRIPCAECLLTFGIMLLVQRVPNGNHHYILFPSFVLSLTGSSLQRTAWEVRSSSIYLRTVTYLPTALLTSLSDLRGSQCHDLKSWIKKDLEVILLFHLSGSYIWIGEVEDVIPRFHLSLDLGRYAIPVQKPVGRWKLARKIICGNFALGLCSLIAWELKPQ